jgi:shikimate kinase
LEGIEENMKVILIGYRASGKSTAGMLLSSRLKIPFTDTDLLLEENLGIPIKEIVALKGWDYFRAMERETIQTLKQKNAGVIATGGGVVLLSENVTLLKQMGVIVWLNAPLPDIINRLKEDAQTEAKRPQFTDSDLVQETADVLKRRIPLYENAADFVVETKDRSVLQVTEEIYQYLLESGIVAKINKSKK